MAGIYFFVVHKGGAAFVNFSSCPLAIGNITKVVFGSNEHGSWNIGDLCQIYIWRSSLTVFFLIDFLSPIVKSERFILNDLTIVNQTLNTSSGREMGHVNGKSIFIIKSWILSNQKALSKEAKIWNRTTDKFCGSIRWSSKN